MSKGFILDCTLRDGGYYNNWDFSKDLVEKYLQAMESISVDYVEIGMRTLKNSDFKGACAFSTDEYLNSLQIPKELSVGVMINASEIVGHGEADMMKRLSKLFPNDSKKSHISLVRIACHGYEFCKALPAINWLKERGFLVGFNLMQAVVDKTEEDIKNYAREIEKYPVDVFYFADSLGSMQEIDLKNLIKWIRCEYSGELGIHAHDNMGRALYNTIEANNLGVKWLDATITGMGRGPGNTQTEFLILEFLKESKNISSLVPLMRLVKDTFKPMQNEYGWGTNPFYYLAGKYEIHPTFIQHMISDSRYSEEDLLVLIEYLKKDGGSKFVIDKIENAKNFYKSEIKGSWDPLSFIENKEVLILGSGPESKKHKSAIEQYVLRVKPLVIALNTESSIDEGLIDLRVASHPIRLMSDSSMHAKLTQPLVVPASMLPEEIGLALNKKKLFDYGIEIKKEKFAFGKDFCTIPNSLVISYALAIVTSGKAKRVLLAGFDGYGADDLRTSEMEHLLEIYGNTKGALELISVTPTSYHIPVKSIYAL